MSCTFPTCKAEGLHWFNPPLCERHWEFVLLVSRAERNQLPLTPAILTEIKGRSVVRWHIEDSEIPQLLAEYRAVPA